MQPCRDLLPAWICATVFGEVFFEDGATDPVVQIAGHKQVKRAIRYKTDATQDRMKLNHPIGAALFLTMTD